MQLRSPGVTIASAPHRHFFNPEVSDWSAVPNPRRILLIVDHFYPVVGGAETLAHEMAQGLAATGDEVHVLTQRVPRAAPAEEQRAGYTVWRMWVPPVAGRLWFMLVAGFYAVRCGPRVDLVHGSGYGSMWPARVAGWLRGVPAVTTIHEVLGENWFLAMGLPRGSAAWFRWLEQRLMRLRFDRYLCVSRYTAERLTRLAGISPDTIDVVYPAVDYDFWQAGRHAARPLRQELGLAVDSRIAIFFGRPGVSKGVDTLLAAAAELAKAPTMPVHFVLLLAHEPAAGRAAAQRMVKESCLSSHVTILEPAPRAELPSYLLAADCVVIPSLSEGFGYSAVEAATLGCPLVVTAGHVFEEVLGDQASYVPPHDPARLAAAIRDVAWASRNSSASRPPLPATFDVGRHIRGVRAAYERACAHRLARSAARCDPS